MGKNSKQNLNPLGKWLHFCHECDCGSEEIRIWYKEENKLVFQYCEKCKEYKFKKHGKSF